MTDIFSVLNTPFDASGQVDLSAMQAHASYAVQAGVAGFLVPGLAGEVDQLSHAERCQLVSAVAQVAGTRPVIAGLGDALDSAGVQLAEQYLQAGCRGLMVNAGRRTYDQLLAGLTALDRLRPGFLMLQDFDPVGDGLDDAIILRLIDAIDSLRWIKIEIIPAGPKYTRLMAATAGKVQVAGGWAVMQMIEALDRGVHAMMPTGLHHTYVRICRLHAAGQPEAARQLFDRLLPILAFSNQRLDISIHFFKRLLFCQRIYPTPNTRLAGPGLDPYQLRLADELIERAMLLEAELGSGAETVDWWLETRQQ